MLLVVVAPRWGYDMNIGYFHRLSRPRQRELLSLCATLTRTETNQHQDSMRKRCYWKTLHCLTCNASDRRRRTLDKDSNSISGLLYRPTMHSHHSHSRAEIYYQDVRVGSRIINTWIYLCEALRISNSVVLGPPYNAIA